jgi:hypothetical protein
MPDEPTREELHAINRQMARDLGSLTAQKLKLALWLAQILKAAGGRVVIVDPINDLSAVHMFTEHRCSGIGHGPSCRAVLELHPGLVEDCAEQGCHRLKDQPEDGPGIRTERGEDRPAARAPAFTEQMLSAERWQHPERN